MFNIIKEETKPIKIKQVNEDKQPIGLAEEFFNIIICLTSITRRLTQQIMCTDKDAEVIEGQKQAIITAIAIITDTLNLDNELEITKTENKKKLKEEVNALEYVEYDVIPLLRFTEIQANLNTVIEGYNDVAENLTYEKTKEIATDLTRIENALDNIATLLSNELANNLIYKEG